jgi:CBS domain-containing protein
MARVERTIAELGCTRDVPRLAPDDTVAKALDVMCRGGHECVLVVDDRPILRGIFTDRDFLRRVAATRRDPAVLALRDVMTERPETLRPRDCVTYAINLMTEGGFRNVPIVEDDRTIVGVVLIWDVLRHLDDICDQLRVPVPTPPEADLSGVTWIDTGGGG